MSTEKTTEANDVILPKNVYAVRCVKADAGKSKVGNPQHILTVEIVDAAPVNGVDINGLQIMHWSTLTEKALKFVNNLRQAFGLETTTENDMASCSPKDYIGLKAFAICESTKVEQKNEVTGEVLRNPYTNEPIVSYMRNIKEWIPQS